MSPAEAGEVLNEPDWRQLWDALQVADDGFETLLRRWREWHHTLVRVGDVEKKKMAPSIHGMIALAGLGIMPPHDKRQGELFQEQIDAHTWFVSEGRAWRIVGIEDQTLFLNSFGEDRQIDLSRAKWTKYCEAAAAALEAQRR